MVHINTDAEYSSWKLLTKSTYIHTHWLCVYARSCRHGANQCTQECCSVQIRITVRRKTTNNANKSLLLGKTHLVTIIQITAVPTSYLQVALGSPTPQGNTQTLYIQRLAKYQQKQREMLTFGDVFDSFTLLKKLHSKGGFIIIMVLASKHWCYAGMKHCSNWVFPDARTLRKLQCHTVPALTMG